MSRSLPWTRGCHCPQCGVARREDDHRRQKLNRWRMETGRRSLVPADQARDLLVAQHARFPDMPIVHFCVAAAILRPQYRRILVRSQEHVTLTTYLSIRDLPHLDQVQHVQLPSGGTRCRQQALAVAGWSVRAVGQAMGLSGPFPIPPQYIHRDSAQRYLEVTRELLAQPGPSVRAAKTARTHGWKSCEEYDQDLFWDVGWDGTGGLFKPLRGAELLEEYDFLARSGLSLEAAASRLGVLESSLERALYRRARERQRDDQEEREAS